MTLITCRDAAFAYEGETVVSGVNFDVSEGDYMCIVGENGSGKSTLVKGMLRLKVPSRGELIFAPELKGGVGYMPQSTAMQTHGDFPASVFEIVLSGAADARLFYTKMHKDAAESNLRRLGALELRDRCYRELSGGQQQRVLLARALMAAKMLLLLDEPSAGLDPVVTRELYREIASINRRDGIAVVMVSHDVAGALKYAEKILHLDHEQVFFGSMSDYLLSDAAKKLVSND